MKINLGRYDILIRMISGSSGVLVGLYMAFANMDVMGLLLAAVSMIVLTTSLLHWCPIYAFLGLSSFRFSIDAPKKSI